MMRNEEVHVGEDTYCENPLRAISELTEVFNQWTELAVTNLFKSEPSKVTENNTGRASRMHYSAMLNEVLSMYLTLCRCFIENNIPIRPSMPSSVIYLCLFSSSTHFISCACEYICVIRQEIVPMCKRRALELDHDGDENGSRVATEQVMDLRCMNMITKDAIAIFAKENSSLQRGESIFKQHWEIEHEEYLKGLSLISHPALLSYVFRFCKEYAKEHDERYTEIYSRLNDPDSAEFYAYIKYVEEHLPNITDLHSVLRATNAPNVTVAGSTISNTTSGVSSMKPSKRSGQGLRAANAKKKKIAE